MNIFEYFETEFASILTRLAEQSVLPRDLDASRVVFELPRDVSHGDLATNAAMILSKPEHKPSRDLAVIMVA